MKNLLLARRMKQQSKNAGSLMYVYPSHSQEVMMRYTTTDKQKWQYIKRSMGKYIKNIIVSRARNVFEVDRNFIIKEETVVIDVGSKS